MPAKSALTSRIEHRPVSSFHAKPFPNQLAFVPTTTITMPPIRRDHHALTSALVTIATGVSTIFDIRRCLWSKTANFTVCTSRLDCGRKVDAERTRAGQLFKHNPDPTNTRSATLSLQSNVPLSTATGEMESSCPNDNNWLIDRGLTIFFLCNHCANSDSKANTPLN